MLQALYGSMEKIAGDSGKEEKGNCRKHRVE
jgi:hypothetical protein